MDLAPLIPYLLSKISGAHTLFPRLHTYSAIVYLSILGHGAPYLSMVARRRVDMDAAFKNSLADKYNHMMDHMTFIKVLKWVGESRSMPCFHSIKDRLREVLRYFDIPEGSFQLHLHNDGHLQSIVLGRSKARDTSK
jgi:hypothetical protein